MKDMEKNKVQKLTLSAFSLALCMVLPFLTGQVPAIGNMLCPMHIPVLLCGYLCGWPYGLAVGFIAPLLRSCVIHLPVLFPTAFAMAFELATYGFMTGITSRILPNKHIYIYLSLIVSMLSGRAVWGVVQFILYGLGFTDFSFEIFMAGAVTNAIPGIVIQLVFVPLIVIAIRRIEKRNLLR